VQVVDAPAVPRRHGGHRQAYRRGRLKYFVLIGDVAADRRATYGGAPLCRRIRASADQRALGFGAHDCHRRAVCRRGRRSAAGRGGGADPGRLARELAAFVRKVLRYEQQADAGPWQRQIKVVAGVGGFGRLADTLIEAAARCVFQQTVPDGYNVQATLASPAGESELPTGGLRWLARQELSGAAWRGSTWATVCRRSWTTCRRRRRRADLVGRRRGAAPLWRRQPLVVLVACYTGRSTRRAIAWPSGSRWPTRARWPSLPPRGSRCPTVTRAGM